MIGSSTVKDHRFEGDIYDRIERGHVFGGRLGDRGERLVVYIGIPGLASREAGRRSSTIDDGGGGAIVRTRRDTIGDGQGREFGGVRSHGHGGVGPGCGVLKVSPWMASDDTIFGTKSLEKDEELGMQGHDSILIHL
jgi:hypothetical protein